MIEPSVGSRERKDLFSSPTFRDTLRHPGLFRATDPIHHILPPPPERNPLPPSSWRFLTPALGMNPTPLTTDSLVNKESPFSGWRNYGSASTE